MKCTACEHEYTDRLSTCPYCGGLGMKSDEETDYTVEKPARYDILSRRIAGIVLLSNVIFGYSFAIISGSLSFISISNIIDLFLCFFLLRDSENARLWTIVRAALGLVLFAVLFMGIGDYFSGFFQIFYCLALLGLLVGKPRFWRIFLCTLFFCIMFGFLLLGIVIILMKMYIFN